MHFIAVALDSERRRRDRNNVFAIAPPRLFQISDRLDLESDPGQSKSRVVVSQLASPLQRPESRPFQLIWPFAATRVPLLSSKIDQSSNQIKDETLLLKRPVDSVAFRSLCHPVKK